MEASARVPLDDDRPDRVPIDHWWGSHPVPDLAAIAEEHWPWVLRQIPSHIRWRAARNTWPRGGAAALAALEIDREEQARAAAAREKIGFPGPLPTPTARSVRLSRDHQVSFRLTPAQYAQIIDAAKTLGLKPAQLARLLTLRGVAQINAEAAGGASG